MGPKDVILNNLNMSDIIIKKYLGDLSDGDLKLQGRRGHAFDRTAAWPSDRGREDVRRVRESGPISTSCRPGLLKLTASRTNRKTVSLRRRTNT